MLSQQIRGAFFCVEGPLNCSWSTPKHPQTSNPPNTNPYSFSIIVHHQIYLNISSPLPHWHISPFPSDLQPLSLTHTLHHHGSIDSVGNDGFTLHGFSFCLCRGGGLCQLPIDC